MMDASYKDTFWMNDKVCCVLGIYGTHEQARL